MFKGKQIGLVMALFVVLGLLLGLPGGASASTEVSQSLRLEAKANADTARAVEVAGESRRHAQDLLRRSRERIGRAYRLTMSVNGDARVSGDTGDAVEASSGFTAAIDGNDERLEELIDRTSGSIERRAASALSRNAEMRVNVESSLAASGEGAEGTSETEVAAALSGIADSRFEAVSEFVATGAGRIGEEGRRHVNDGIATLIEAQERLSSEVVRFHGTAEAEVRSRLAEVAGRIAAITSRMRGFVDETGNSEVSVSVDGSGSTTLGGLALRVEGNTRANAHGLASAQAGAHGSGSVAFPSLP